VRDLVKAWLTELGDAYTLGLVRMLLGVLIFWEALGWGRQLVTVGYFGDAFHMPFLPEWAVPPRAGYTAVLASMLVLAALATVGHRPRVALGGGALLGLYVLLCDRIEFHHNRYALFCFAGLVAMSPCDRSFLIAGPSVAAAGRVAPLWAQRLAQLQVSIIYVASGGSKLFDADWRDGLVLADRVARHAGEALARGVPSGVVDWLAGPSASSALAKLAIATELFLAVGLWLRRTRVYALWWGVLFHLTIEVTSKVEIFTWLMLTTYALFASPDVRARKLFFDPSRAKGALCAHAVMLLDWLARFDVVPWQPDGLRTGHSIVVVRRDGSRATGVRALAMVARCVPLLFPLWAPIAFAASFTKGGETSTGS
jgi:hypothetical protein